MSSPSQPSRTTQVNEVKLSPEQKAIADLAFPFASQYAKSDIKPIFGEMAGFNPNELFAQQLAVGNAGLGQQTGQSANLTNQFLLNPALLSPESNPYLQQHGDALSQTIMRQFTEGALPQLRAGANVTGGPFSGGNTKYGVAEGLASGRTTDSIGAALAQLYSGAYGQGLEALGGAVRNAPIAQSTLEFAPGMIGQVGAQQRAMEQAQIDTAKQNQALEQSFPLLRARELYELAFGMPGGQGISTVTGAMPPQNRFAGGLGGALTGAMAGSMVMPGIGTGIGAGLGALLSLFG